LIAALADRQRLWRWIGLHTGTTPEARKSKLMAAN